MTTPMGRLHDWDTWTEWAPANNDLPPTEPDPDDYAPWWDTEPEADEPHPDMEGYICSAGWAHVTHYRAPVPPVGLARLPLGALPYETEIDAAVVAAEGDTP